MTSGGALRAWNAAVFVAWAVGPFVAARDPLWPAGWAHVAALVACATAQRAYVARRNPGLLAARRRIGAGTARWDLAWNALFWPLLAAVAVVGGIDAGRGTALPAWTAPAGALLLAAGFALAGRAMAVNPFYEGTVRLQRERGQVPVEAGPYARVRHPGYAGLALWACATPLLLRSPRALAPAAATVAWIALRTALEDRLLRRGLAGYDAYARRVRWRLLPGVW